MPDLRTFLGDTGDTVLVFGRTRRLTESPDMQAICDGPGWTRTTDRRIMSPALPSAPVRRHPDATSSVRESASTLLIRTARSGASVAVRLTDV